MLQLIIFYKLIKSLKRDGLIGQDGVNAQFLVVAVNMIAEEFAKMKVCMNTF